MNYFKDLINDSYNDLKYIDAIEPNIGLNIKIYKPKEYVRIKSGFKFVPEL